MWTEREREREREREYNENKKKNTTLSEKFEIQSKIRRNTRKIDNPISQIIRHDRPLFCLRTFTSIKVEELYSSFQSPLAFVLSFVRS
jgi:hypothetical protein